MLTPFAASAASIGIALFAAASRPAQARPFSWRWPEVASSVSVRYLFAIRPLPTRPQPRQQLRGRPAVGGDVELDLQVADGDAGFQAEHSVDPADVVAALLQELLHFALLLEGDL